jgi:hypothetical protein
MSLYNDIYFVIYLNFYILFKIFHASLYIVASEGVYHLK